MASRLFGALRRFWAEQAELAERQVLLNRPWNEEFLHWSGDPAAPELHGQYLPPDRRRRSVTRSGWCPGNGSEAGSVSGRSDSQQLI